MFAQVSKTLIYALTPIFAQLLFFSCYHTLSKGQFLYQKGDIGLGFFIVVRGQVQLLVKPEGSDEFKQSKQVYDNELFAYRESKVPRPDYAKIVTDTCELLELNI